MVSKDSQNYAEINSFMHSVKTYYEVLKNDLTEMSSILFLLKIKNRIIVDTFNKNVKIKIGQETNCITIAINSSNTTEELQTFFSNISQDRICFQVQEFIEDKDYPLVVRGKLITF